MVNELYYQQLIKDLKESGQTATAEDMQDLLDAYRKTQQRLAQNIMNSLEMQP
ncbi:hypothetical protein [Amphritea sp. HPY]|uniref:hypothetical protein n=1 Tax=Amphritea sp. HPY TaxID=3421652 RepID=UPI003D7D3301